MFTPKDMRDGLVLAKKYTKSIQDAEDVLSKACEKALLKKEQCAGKFGPWFRAIVRTTALNHHRADKPKVPLTEQTDDWLGKEQTFYTEGPSCIEMISTLTDKEKDLILSRYVDKIPQKKIAKKYGVTTPTIRAWTSETLYKLRRKYENQS